MKNDGVFTRVESSTRQYLRAVAQVLPPVCLDRDGSTPFRLPIAFVSRIYHKGISFVRAGTLLNSAIIHFCNLNRTNGRLLKPVGKWYGNGCRYTIFQRSLYARSDFPDTCL
jgi:hypothetical protein